MDTDGHCLPLLAARLLHAADLGDAAGPPDLGPLVGGHAPEHAIILVLEGPLEALADNGTTRANLLRGRRGVAVRGEKDCAVLVEAVAGG